MPLSREQLTSEFWQLQDQIDDIKAKSGPKRQARDQKVNQYDAEIRVLDQEIKVLEDGLFDLQNQQAMASRALGGTVGERPARAEPSKV